MMKLVAVVLLAVAALGYGIAIHPTGPVADQPARDVYLKQLENNDAVPTQIQADYTRRNQAIASQLWMAGGGGTLAATLFVLLTVALRRNGSSVAPKPAASREL